MKVARVLLLTAALSYGVAALNAQSGYCTVFGDRFIDENGEDFFPMVMNYYVDYACYNVYLDVPSPNVSHFRLCQTSLYGQDGEYDYSPIGEGPEHILQDFYEMSNMGFNTVRVIMTPWKLDPVVGFKIAVKHFPSGQDPVMIDLDPPYDDTNPVFAFHMEQVLTVCSLANVVGLKILLITADGHNVFNGNAGSTTVDDYRDFLAGVADYIHDNEVHNLFAYDLYGEPSLSEHNLPTYHTKDEICAVVEEWNTAIKGNDPDHLTTIGGDIFTDVFRGGWDPMLIAVDFATLHFYPWTITAFEGPYPDYLPHITKRYLDRVYVFDKTLHKPYMLGETSFAAHDPDPLNPGDFSYPFTVMGTEADGNDFIENTFPAIRDSRAAGYAWWDFQQKHWYPDPPDPNDPLIHPGDWWENHYGLLRRGDPDASDLQNGYENSTTHLRKEAAQTFADWTTSPPGPATPLSESATVDMSPYTLYNPYAHPVNTAEFPDAVSPYRWGTMTGHVVDQNNVPIAYALIKGNSTVGIDADLQPIGYEYSTYTDENGDFELRGYDHSPGNSAHPITDPGELEDRIIENLDMGAYASSWINRGWYDGPIQQDEEYVLNRLDVKWNVHIDGETVDIGDTRNASAIQTIVADAFVIDGNLLSDGGHSELTARAIQLNPGFHAVKGSDVHVRAEISEVSCSDIETLDLRSAPMLGQSEIMNDGARRAKFIELQLNDPVVNLTMDVRPNPSHDRFVISFDETTAADMLIVDGFGAVVSSFVFSGRDVAIDFSDKAPGVYTIIARTGTSSMSQRLIHF